LANEETTSHIFLSFPFAQEVWGLMTSPWSISLQFEEVSSLFSKWALTSPVSSHSKDFLGFSWLILPKFICWKLWLERNNRIFRGICSSPPQVEVKIKALMGDFLCSQPAKFIFSPLNSLEESWFIPLNPGKLSESGQDPKLQAWEIIKNSTEFLIWKKKVGRHLLVFDGASKWNPGKAGGGGGLFDPKGNLIWKFSWGLGVETNNVAEALALWKGLNQASHLGITYLTVVGDSRLIIQVVIT
jgi:hypothetical protein